MNFVRFAGITIIALSIVCSAQNVQVGAGSYGTVLPPGAVGPQTSSGAPVFPKVSTSFQKPAQTSDFWSSLIFPFYGDPHSNNLFAHPMNFRAKNNGLQIGYTTTPVFAGQDYLFPFSHQLTAGIAGLNSSNTVTDDYGDWTVTAMWYDGTRRLRATFGHGLPFVFFTISGGNAIITSNSTPAIWYNQRGVIGMTVEGKHYGVFAPDSSVWTGTASLQSSLNGKNYFSVALLPDNTTATLEFYRKHAYAFVTGSAVSWTYDKSASILLSDFVYTTELKESGNGNLNQTLTALYRHQWLNTTAPLTAYEYISVAGKMKVYDGNQFSTELAYEGVLPALPDEGVYNKTDLLAMVNAVTSETLPDSGNNAGTYWNGKLMARFAHLVNIADQIGAVTARDYFLSQIKTRLQEWFTAGGRQSYVYNSNWKTLTGYPSEFGADNQINDHHFHAGYAIMAAAIVAQFDPAWAAQENWGGMVNLLIKDGNNWDRSDTRFPFLRSFDPYAGHAWAAGHGDFGDGNNEESSSESMNFATATILWGEITQQNDIRDLGIYLYATERSAIEQYWFDVDDAVFPASYPYKGLGMVWGAKGVHSTWFGADPDFIHGINMLPFTGGSMYLGRRPEYAELLYQEIVNELSGSEPTWKDIMWQYQSFFNPAAALTSFFADTAYIPEEGGTKAHTYHWLGNLKKMGRPEPSVTANIPTYAVFKNSAGEKTYVAYNAASDSVTVTFSDGYSMRVGPRKMRSQNTSSVNINAPIAILMADKTTGKSPLTVRFTGSRSFDRNNSPLSYHWTFGDGATAAAADPQHIYTVPGIYKAVLTVTNQLNLTSNDSVTIKVLGNGTPYLGSPVMIPGIIQAENFDLGGEGIAYHDVNANNIGMAYRPNEGVDIEPSSTQGYDVYWMVAGEWLEYTITVPSDTVYDIIPYVSTVPGFGNFRIFVNNIDVSGKRFVLNTGGWQSWAPIPIRGVRLNAGTQILRIEINTDVASERKNWLFSLNYFQMNYSTATSVNERDETPLSFELYQNYPNPFGNAAHTDNSSTSFTFSSRYTVPFSAGKLPSGIYFYKLEAKPSDGAPSFSKIMKMTIIK
ncbi:MAG: carbohydrate-binding protein [Ignavibacteriaceae bacterium]|nr:carbohydrate-binding protein [Ignavibacteriaceae bacterium]